MNPYRATRALMCVSWAGLQGVRSWILAVLSRIFDSGTGLPGIFSRPSLSPAGKR